MRNALKHTGHLVEVAYVGLNYTYLYPKRFQGTNGPHPFAHLTIRSHLLATGHIRHPSTAQQHKVPGTMLGQPECCLESNRAKTTGNKVRGITAYVHCPWVDVVLPGAQAKDIALVSTKGKLILSIGSNPTLSRQYLHQLGCRYFCGC